MLFYKILENTIDFPAEVFDSLSDGVRPLILGLTASEPAEQLVLKWPGRCLRTAPHLPPWAIGRLRPLLCTPEQSLSRSEARRGLRSPAQAATQS